MRLRYGVACTVAAVIGVTLTVMRVTWAPTDPVKSGLYTLTLCLLGLALIALFLLCGVRRRALTVSEGRSSVIVAAAAAWAGAALVIHGGDVVIKLCRGEHPYPKPLTPTTLNTILELLMIAGALLGGVFLLITAVRWFYHRRTDRASSGRLALCPEVWLWARLLWYITSFASAINRFQSVVETVLLLFEMLFLLAFARYASGVEDKAPRFAIPVALGTALLGFVSCFTRFGAYLLQDSGLFSGTALLVAPDLAIAVLAAVFSAQQMFAVPLPASDTEEEGVGDDGEDAAEDEDAAEFLLDVDALAMDNEDEDEDALSEEERHPLDIEEIIDQIINRKS